MPIFLSLSRWHGADSVSSSPKLPPRAGNTDESGPGGVTGTGRVQEQEHPQPAPDRALDLLRHLDGLPRALVRSPLRLPASISIMLSCRHVTRICLILQLPDTSSTRGLSTCWVLDSLSPAPLEHELSLASPTCVGPSGQF